MQVMSEGYEEVKENIDKASKDLMKSIEDVVEQSTEPLTELAKQTQAASEQAIEAISEVTKSNQKLAKSSTAMIDGMQKANEALSAMTEHYSDTGVLDEQILEKVEEQMFAIKDEIKTIIPERQDAKKEKTNLHKLKPEPFDVINSLKKLYKNLDEEKKLVFQEVYQAVEEIWTTSSVQYKGRISR